MKSIILKNKQIQKILDDISNCVFDQHNLKKIIENEHTKERKCKIITDHPPTSDEYFYTAYKKRNIEDFGYPSSALMESYSENSVLFNLIKNKVLKLSRKLCVHRVALCSLYPENGYIGWHHNGNAPGYNLLLTYSIDGNGCFKYYDYEDKEIKKINDVPGWNVKVGYYPKLHTEVDRVYWHSAETKSPRLSIAFVVDDRELWLAMINDITNSEYDKKIVDQGPR